MVPDPSTPVGAMPMQPRIVHLVEVWSISQVSSLDVGQAFLLTRNVNRIDATLRATALKTLAPSQLGGALCVVSSATWSGGGRVLSFESTSPEIGDVVWSKDFGILLRFEVLPDSSNSWVPFKSDPQKLLDDMQVFLATDAAGVYDFYAALCGGMLHSIYDDATKLAQSKDAEKAPPRLLGRLGPDLLAVVDKNDTEEEVRAKVKNSVSVVRERGNGDAPNLSSFLTSRVNSFILNEYTPNTWASVHVRIRRWLYTWPRPVSNNLTKPFVIKPQNRESYPVDKNIRISLRPPSITGILDPNGLTQSNHATLTDAASWHILMYCQDDIAPEPETYIDLATYLDGSSGYRDQSGASLAAPPALFPIRFVEGTASPALQQVQTLKHAFVAVSISGGSVVTGTYTIPVSDRGSYMTAPSISFNSPTGSGASATVNFSGGRVVSITVTSGGSGFIAAPDVVFSGDVSAATVMTNLRAAWEWLRVNDFSGAWYDVAPANQIGPYGYTREGVNQSATGVPSQGPEKLAFGYRETLFHFADYWPTDATHMVFSSKNGTYLDPTSALPVATAIEYARASAAYMDVAVPSTVAYLVPQDSRDASGAATPRDDANDPLSVGGEFEILATSGTGITTTGSFVTFPAQGATQFATVVKVGPDMFLDNMRGVSYSDDMTNRYRPAGQTLMQVSTP